MDFDKTKIMRIAIITVIFLSMLFVGQWFYMKHTLENSVINALSKKTFVESVDIQKENNKLVFNIKLKNIDNLMAAYNEIYNFILTSLKDRPFSINIISNPNKLLEDIYDNKLQFSVYEAIQTGNYTKMKAELDNIKTLEQIDAKAYIDSDNLCLQLKNNKNYLYKIISKSIDKG